MVITVVLTLVATGCGRGPAPGPPPPPAELTRDAVGHYCGMLVAEHSGPKGQIFLEDQPLPLWFSSVRDTIAFTLLPEESKAIRAIYVNDMAKAVSWNNPGSAWVPAAQAHYVIGSRRRGGMGAAEAVPFSTASAARKFAHQHGGQVLSIGRIPPEYVLGGPEIPGPKGRAQHRSEPRR